MRILALGYGAVAFRVLWIGVARKRGFDIVLGAAGVGMAVWIYAWATEQGV